MAEQTETSLSREEIARRIAQLEAKQSGPNWDREKDWPELVRLRRLSGQAQILNRMQKASLARQGKAEVGGEPSLSAKETEEIIDANIEALKKRR